MTANLARLTFQHGPDLTAIPAHHANTWLSPFSWTWGTGQVEFLCPLCEKRAALLPVSKSPRRTRSEPSLFTR